MINFKRSKLLETNNKVEFDLSTFIPLEHRCRLIQSVVNKLDLESIISSYSPLGQRGISPQMLLSVIFYGYSEGVRSGRLLAERCKRDLHYVYLSGGLQPSKTTINAFRKVHHSFFKSLFEQQVNLLQSIDVMNTSEGHGDGSTIRANASSKRVKTKEQYAKWLKTLELDIKEIKEEIAIAANSKVSKEEEISKSGSLKKKLDKQK